MSQLALPLKLQDHAVFASFLSVGNEALCSYLQQLTNSENGDGCFLWGQAATGKTHLLQALCAKVGDRSVYLPLAEFVDLSADILAGLEERPFICLDDLHRVAGRPEWEVALFELMNAVKDRNGTIVIAATATPREIGIRLADLQSRLTKLTVFHTVQLNEKDRIEALRLRAKFRGLELPTEVAKYLLSRNRRDMQSLYQLLDKLDVQSLVAQRRLTVPFVRQVLAAE